jgi:fatty-acid desaturase
MLLSNEYKIKLLLIFNHFAFLFGLIYANIFWLSLTVVGWILINRVGGEIALHRYFSHKSFKTTKNKEILLFVLSVFNCVGSPMMWVGIHRKHHTKSDTDEDPHGNQSILKVWSTFWKPYYVETQYLIDLMKTPTHRFFHKNYFKIVIVTYLLLGLIAWQIPVFLISGSSLITLHSAGLVNTVCHRYGYRNFNTKDKSTNNTFVNLITLGSGLHNNHHADPMNYSNKVTNSEHDFPGWVIKRFFMLKEEI